MKQPTKQAAGSKSAATRAKKVPAKAGAIPVLKFIFGEGDFGSIPLPDAEGQLHDQYHKMANSDSPELREVGKQKLREVALRTSSELLRRVGASKGGSKKPAPAWHAKCVTKAKTYLATGTERHELAGKLAKNFGKGEKAVREVLKKAGLK